VARVRRFSIVVLGGLLAMGACSSANQGDSQGATANTPFAAGSSGDTTGTAETGQPDGAQLFRTKCAGCHGPQGQGNLGPTLVAIASRTPIDAQTQVVALGKGTMPAFKPGLTDAEIAAVLEYVNTELR
jgi:mono/diheme cytochrome c family protein